MNRMAKALLSPAFHHVYWAVMNRRNDHRVESWSVSRKARIGFRSIIRKGVEVGPDVELGDFSYISGPETYVESARIGRFCSIARRTVIGVSGKDMARVTTHNFPSSPAYGGLTRETRLPAQRPAPVIGHDVWIGINAVILRGVTIGHGAVIGANSVVSRDVPPYAVVGGNPARHIRDRFAPDQIAALLRIAWWDWNRESLAARSAEFLDTESFIRRHDPAPAPHPQEA